MKTKLIFSLLVVLLFGICACNRHDNTKCTDANTHRVVPLIGDFFFFKEGSWWVYQNEQTLETDSIWVGRDSSFIPDPDQASQSCKCGYGNCSEVKYVRFYNIVCNRPGNSYLEYLFNPDKTDNSTTLVDESSDYYFPSPNNANFWTIDRIFFRQGKIDNPSATHAQWQQEDSVTAGNNRFEDILHISYPDSSYGINDWMLQGWYARHVHLVKYIRKSDKSTWNLIRYHVVQ